FFLSVALLPTVVTGIAHLMGLAPRGPDRLRPLQLGVVLAAACFAAGLAHPQGVFSGIVLGVPILLWAVALRGRDLLRRLPGAGARFWPAAVLAVVVLIASWQVWIQLRPSEDSAVWGPNASWAQAIDQTLSLSPNATISFVPFALLT